MEDNTNIGGNTPETQATTPAMDYEQEYKKQSIEIERLRNAISKTNSENAEYKRKEVEKMTDDEKKAKEYNDLIENSKKMQEKIAEYELRETLSNNGFNAEEIKSLMESKCSPEAYSNIFKAREEQLKKSINAEAIANLTKGNVLGVGSTGDPANTKSDFAKFQEAQFNSKSSERVEFN